MEIFTNTPWKRYVAAGLITSGFAYYAASSILLDGTSSSSSSSQENNNPNVSHGRKNDKEEEGDDPVDVFLNRERKQVILTENIQLSHDSVLLRFRLDNPKQILGLPVGKHFKLYVPNLLGAVKGEWNGKEDPTVERKEIERAYTPTTGDETPGFVDLVVKVYAKNQHPKFVDGGKVSQQLGLMKVGDSIDICGPFGLIEYLGRGTFRLNKNLVTKTHIGMVAGGSGITPMYQVIVAALRDKNDTTRFSMIYANQTEQDILLRKELEQLQAENPDRLWIHYTLDRPPEKGWNYSSGFVNAAMIKAILPPPGPETLIFACGPPPMIDFALKPNLALLGYAKSDLAIF